MKILLLGKNGQVGWELQRSLAPLGELVALDRSSRNPGGDLTALDEISETVRSLRPDVIVNAAAHTAVDKAEGEPLLARTLNALAPARLAHEARQIGAWLFHYSTDYVFDGSGTSPWSETDVASPLSVYGSTKFEGEQLIAAACERHVIFRTSWVYASRGGNFVRTMLRLAQERERLTVIDDQTGAPTGSELLADVTAHAIRHVMQRPSDAGLYHLTAAGETTWHGYAEYVLQTAMQLKPELKLLARDVDPVPTSAFPTPARRPHNSRLDCSRLEEAFGFSMPGWQRGVSRMLSEIL